MMTRRRSQGYSIVELMVALVIGLILLLGVMAVFVTSRTSFDASETQAHMSDDGRFAMTLFGEDLRMAGTWGPNSFTTMVDNRTQGPAQRLPALPPITSGDCGNIGDLYYTDLDLVIFASNNDNPFPDTCIPAAEYMAGTDVLVVRYADPNPVANANVAPGVVYVRSETGNSVLFTGTVNGGADVPAFPVNGTNHVLRMHVYYVAPYTEVAGDGIPSLHRISLEPGPTLVDEMIVSGVENFQVQLGFDTQTPEPDGKPNVYINADSTVINWANTVHNARVRGARIWLLLRSQRGQKTAPTPITYSMGGADFTPSVTDPVTGDDYKRLMVSGVYDLRNFPLQAPQ